MMAPLRNGRFISIGLLISIIFSIFSNANSAYARDNTLEAIIGGLLVGGLIGSAMVDGAKNQWNNLPEPRRSCLINSLNQSNINVNALIQNGIGPDDQRLAQFNFPCEQIQNQKDQEEAAAQAAEEQRLADEEEEKARLANEEKQRERQRISELKSVKLKQNISCVISEGKIEYRSFCDEAIFLKSSLNDDNSITIKFAIDQKYSLADLRITNIERPDSKSRRIELMSKYTYLREVSKPSINCDKSKDQNSKTICSSNELSLMDSLNNEYSERLKGFSEKEFSKIFKDNQKSFSNCKANFECLKNSYIISINSYKSALSSKGIQIASYEDNLASRNLNEEAEKKAEENRILAEKLRIEEEVKLKEELEQKQRLMKEAAEKKLKQEQEAAELKLRIQKEELERIESEKKQKKLELKKLWLIASEKLKEETGNNNLNSCLSSKYADSLLSTASSIKDRKNIRQKVNKNCKCFATSMMIDNDFYRLTSADLRKYFLSSTDQQQPQILSQIQLECEENIDLTTIENWAN